jgi:hypothetical protein
LDLLSNNYTFKKVAFAVAVRKAVRQPVEHTDFRMAVDRKMEVAIGAVGKHKDCLGIGWLVNRVVGSWRIEEWKSNLRLRGLH